MITNGQPVDPTIPVKLVRMFIGKTGNSYFPGIYKPGELPEKAYTTYYVVPVELNVESTTAPSAHQDSKITNGAFKSEELIKKTLNVDTTDTLKPTVSLTPQDAFLINQMSFEALVDMNGIGKSTANKIIEKRQEKPFVDYIDLTARVPLPLGRNWENYFIDFKEGENQNG